MKKAKVSKELAQFIIDRSGGYCEIDGCGSALCCQIHHLLRRNIEANQDNLKMLCWNHHLGTYGIHGREGHKLDLKLKLELQAKYFAQGNSEDEVRALMGGMIEVEEE